MGLIIGRGVRLEVGKTEGPVKTVSAITQAKPPVASSTAHGLLAKSIAYLRSVEGMVQLEGQAVRMNPVATDNVTLEGMNTSGYPAFSGTTELVPITAWATVLKATNISSGGGAASPLDSTGLEDDIAQQENGLLAAQTVTIDIRSQDVPDEAAALIEDAAINQTPLVFRVTFKSGAVRVFRGTPSLPGESVALNQIGTGQFTVSVKGFIIKGAP